MKWRMRSEDHRNHIGCDLCINNTSALRILTESDLLLDADDRPADGTPLPGGPQPAYTPSPQPSAGQRRSEGTQYMDVDQVGTPASSGVRIVVLQWLKETDPSTGKEFAAYVLEVSAEGQRYKIRRRWNEVSKFHAQLKRLNAGPVPARFS